MEQTALGQEIRQPPHGKGVVKWLGPGFLWMVSAAGSGELLFSPRIGALYGYSLLWALIAAVVLKWFINREIGRFTVCTGSNIIEGFSTLGGPRNLALYLILIPQLFVAVATIAGLAGSSGSALIVMFNGDIRFWTIGSILVSSALVIFGRFKLVELAATILAMLLALVSLIACMIVFPDIGDLTDGLIPKIGTNVNYGEILPWLGFMLSGAAGMIWYSYWLQKKGYGRSEVAKSQKTQDTVHYSEADKKKLNGWVRQMTLDNSCAVFGTLIITIAFLILGVEMLRPNGLVPEEDKVARILGQLLGQLWGPAGFWFMILGVFIGFWSTILSDQDGFGRMFAGGTRILLPANPTSNWKSEAFLKKFYVIVVVTVLPILLYLSIGNPVSLLKLAGFIEAAHIPVLVGLVLYLNHKKLPSELKPSIATVIMTAMAGLFFTAFAIIYVLQITGTVKFN